jgi:hypothetical protein
MEQESQRFSRLLLQANRQQETYLQPKEAVVAICLLQIPRCIGHKGNENATPTLLSGEGIINT